ncbi:sialate O-acetylesterase [Pseudochryseolinea flava]|uniref:Sialate O-acetylesterase n=1 Tax=Pseudochryseolinea flava TaxID=2059302 RepID=A0A364XY78_9BACT|nr:sialate O-acetylesterase [Pseudochryseolinea flava]RAV98379.1 sialate O-acetylesterase [Pseudochryseolinea flava]
MRKTVLLITLLVATTTLHAQLRLASLFTDHMVIQQQSPVPIWGWSYPSQEVVIKVSWDTTTYRVKSLNTTEWRTFIFSPAAGGPHTITIKAGWEERVLKDVMSGEVWLCSGQSNMEWGMHMSADGKEVTEQVNDPNIRLFQVSRFAADAPQLRGEGEWKVCDKEAVRYFSAVGYFFAKRLNGQLNVPVGIISCAWGGTPAEAWIPKSIVYGNPTLRDAAAKLTDDKPWCPTKPEVVYNGMLRPLIPYRVAGVLWYQGEANVGSTAYKPLMEELIKDWRREFLYDFPFYYVQIAPFAGYGEFPSGALLREQQTKMLEIPNTGMVVVTDVVDDVKDIHPKYKKPVGERLANLALGDRYGKEGIAYRNPIFKQMNVEKGKVRISFDYVLTGLVSKGGEPNEFMIAGADKKFYPAKAKIEGKTVVVSAKEVKDPVAVRFAFKNGSLPNLFSTEGLPVNGFRTDSWGEEEVKK